MRTSPWTTPPGTTFSSDSTVSTEAPPAPRLASSFLKPMSTPSLFFSVVSVARPSTPYTPQDRGRFPGSLDPVTVRPDRTPLPLPFHDRPAPGLPGRAPVRSAVTRGAPRRAHLRSTRAEGDAQRGR
ncbi:hypothetical protein GCM10023329_49300 [Streptomyces sanyensis]|uniref:Uncharacterized protein n=1 Tax=Streptomyces sanyensis TaxID=568869 RepID=A0ABP9B794_9ACTN